MGSSNRCCAKGSRVWEVGGGPIVVSQVVPTETMAAVSSSARGGKGGEVYHVYFLSSCSTETITCFPWYELGGQGWEGIGNRNHILALGSFLWRAQWSEGGWP